MKITHPIIGRLIINMTAFIAVIMTLTPFGVDAMSKAGHLRGSGDIAGVYDLIGTTVEKGGVGNYSVEKIRSVGDWIDNPAQKTGKYMNRKAGEILRPSNHGHLRHNPLKVERVFKDPAAKNIARVHKIQDIHHNTAGVDGWKPTPKMKKEAEVILRYIRRYKRLPKRLPSWVDKSGPLIRSGGKSINSAAGKSALALVMPRNPKPRIPDIPRIPSKRFPIPPEKLPRRLPHPNKTSAWGKLLSPKVMVPVGAALAAGISIYQYEKVEAQYAAGKIDDRERRHLNNENLFKTVGEMAAMGALLVIPVSGPALIVVAGSIVAFVAVDYTAGQLAAAYSRWQDREIEEKTILLAGADTAIGVFDLEPSELAATGISGAELDAYTRAYNAWREKYPEVRRPEADMPFLFDGRRFLLAQEAGFYAGMN